MKVTNPYLRNLFFEVDDIPANPLVHLFLYITLAFGVCFTLLADPTGASATALYQLTTSASFGNTSLWGIACIATTALNTLGYVFRRKWLGRTAGYMGFSVWLYALIIYIGGHFWFGIIVAAVPNLLFWIWHFVQVSRYYRKFHEGVPPQRKQQ